MKKLLPAVVVLAGLLLTTAGIVLSSVDWRQMKARRARTEPVAG